MLEITNLYWVKPISIFFFGGGVNCDPHVQKQMVHLRYFVLTGPPKQLAQMGSHMDPTFIAPAVLQEMTNYD